MTLGVQEARSSASAMAPTGKSKKRPRRAELRGARLLACQLGLFAAILLAWEAAVRLGWAKVYIYGQPSGILTKFLTLLSDGELIRHTVITAQEAIWGFVIGSALGSASGLLLWLVPNLANVLRPILIAINGVPKIALAPLIIVWFGIGIEAKIAIAASLTFIVSLITTYAGVGQVDDDLIRLMRSLGATRTQIWSKIVVPASVPWIASGLRLNIGFALIGAVVGEYISAKEGLGYLVYYSGVLYDLNSVWVGIFALMALALVLDYVINQIERRLAWK
jgi:NitT/TauT family transport system permease protein